MTKQTCRIDYMRGTTQDEQAIRDAAQGYFSDNTTTPSVPLYGYKHALKHNSSGALYLFGGHTPSMGNCQQFSGMAITSLMEAFSQSSVPALAYIFDDRWKVTRLDVAIDIFNPELRPRHIYAALDRKDLKSIWRSWREVAQKDLDAGHTVYGGGLESEKRIRIYDKAAEQGVEGVWTRYEMVFSGKRADEVWQAIKGLRTDAELLPYARALLTSMVDFPDWQTWRDEFGEAGVVQWVEVPRVESDTWRWLVAQVMPTFRNDYERTGNWGLLERFVRECKGNMD